ncbi:acyl-CoA dehydrogenase [Balneolales bacterium ANBcel1]|nr:acyl-CoA dehydrogenase [Balneolales bacterium ANBcel1]
MRQFPLQVFLSEEHGGMGANTGECLAMLEASSYESLPLSLMMGINGALFIQPVTRYADKSEARNIFKRFAAEQAMGGLMITEPDYGSDALHMQSRFTGTESGYHVKGLKHWAGLTGWADYWILTAREQKKDGSLARDIDFFIHDSRNSGVEVEEYFNNLGLYMLPYGRNRIDAYIPESHRLIKPSTGIKLLLDMLHRSRLQFPGMASGFLKRILDDAMVHVTSRHVGGRALFQYDQVRERIQRMQAWVTSCSAMCAFTSVQAPIDRDLSAMDVAANAIKSVVTDMMQEASQSFLQLSGAVGYRLDHMAGRAVVDSRPFQIFEGSNDILYQQITESIVKRMKKEKAASLYAFLEEYELTAKASGYLRSVTDFALSPALSQRKQVALGKMLGLTVVLNLVIELGEKGFQSQLIQNTIGTLTSDINKILNYVHESADINPVDLKDDATDWFGILTR